MKHFSEGDEWYEGRLRVDLYAEEPPEGWNTGYCELRCETDEGDWGQVWFRRSEWEEGDESHPLEMLGPRLGVENVKSHSDSSSVRKETKTEEPYNDLMAATIDEKPEDEEDLKSLEEVHRERASEAAEGVRPQSYQLIIMADEITRYAASDGERAKSGTSTSRRRRTASFPPRWTNSSNTQRTAAS